MATITSSDSQPQENCAQAILLGDERMHDPLLLFHLIQKGIPAWRAARALTALGVTSNEQIVAKIVGMPSIKLRRAARDPKKVLSSHQSTCVWYFLAVFALAERVIGPHQIAQRWITAPSLGLNGYAPIDLLINPFGYEIVCDFLARLEYGVYS